jgi:hypothetical protein
MTKNKININNYESYIIDFIEGNLSNDLADEFVKFINENPHIKEELSDLANYTLLPDENVTFDFKQSLKQNDNNPFIDINEANCHEFMIAYYENDLDNSQKQALLNFLANNPQFENDFNLFKYTKAEANKEITYTDKNKLKKYTLPKTLYLNSNFYKTVGIAASFLIIFSLLINYIIPSQKNEYIQTSAVNINKDNSVKTFKANDNNTIKAGTKNESVSQIISNNIKKIVPEANTKKTPTELSRINYIESIMQNSIAASIDETHRQYYTSLNELMIFAGDSPTNINLAELDKKDNSGKISDNKNSMFADQPIIAAGSYLVNLAVVSICRLEEFGNNLKESYNTLEKKLENK